MKIILLHQALHDLAWFHQYYQHVFPAGSDRARAQFASFRQALQENPFLGHTSDRTPGARELHIARTPFTMVYRVTDTHIEVLRLWDSRQGEG